MRWEDDCDSAIDAEAIGAWWALNNESLVPFSRTICVFVFNSLKTGIGSVSAGFSEHLLNTLVVG